MARRTTKKRRQAKPAHRPTLYSAAVKTKLCEAISLGDSIDEACKRVGISRTTFFEWQQWKSDFADAVEGAKFRRLEWLEEAWARIGLKDWKAGQAMLRALKPKKFAERINVHVETELTAALARLKEAFADDPEQLERALSAVAGEPGSAGAPSDASRPDGHAPQSGGEAVRAPPAVGDATRVPGA